MTIRTSISTFTAAAEAAVRVGVVATEAGCAGEDTMASGHDFD